MTTSRYLVLAKDEGLMLKSGPGKCASPIAPNNNCHLGFIHDVRSMFSS